MHGLDAQTASLSYQDLLRFIDAGPDVIRDLG